MPRQPRELVAGGVYHVWARGNRKAPIFADDGDRRQYLLMWGSTVEALGWRPLAYCLMDNHVHHLVETPKPNLDIGMRLAHGCYARYFNDLRGHVGHVFQGRYGTSRPKTDGALWYFAAYIALNPVRAGMCRRPEEHPWSSHAAAMGRVDAPRWLDLGRLMSFFGEDGPDRYRQIVEAIGLLGAAGFEPPLSRLD